METFEVGEVAIYWRPESPVHGMEVTIASQFSTHQCRDHCDASIPLRPIDGYLLKEPSPNGKTWFVQPFHLRKKRPVREDHQIVSWESLRNIWRPAGINA